MSEFTGTAVKVDGGEIWAEDTGGGGVPLVLLHPGVGDSRVWDPVLPALRGRHRVIRYDARGFGRSPAPTRAYTQGDDLRAVLDHFSVPRAVLVGSSMGGETSIAFALSDPERVAGLALLVPGISGYEGLEVPEVTEEIARLARAGDMDGLVALGLRFWGRAGTPPDPEATALLRAAIPAWFTTYAHEVRPAPAFGHLSELAVPAALLLGERDQQEVIDCNEAVAACIPGCVLVRCPDSDHFPTLRVPGVVVELVEGVYGRVGVEPERG